MASLASKEVTQGDQKILGRDGDRDRIIQWLLSDTSCNLSAMVIVGEAGIGKTALAKLVYDDSTVKENFSIRAWLHVADGSDAATISKAIFSSITGKSSWSGRESFLPQSIVQERVNGKRLLLVLDGFEDLHPTLWEHLRAPFSRVRMGKFLITRRLQSDAVKDAESYVLPSLPEDLSLKLLLNCALGSGSRRGLNFRLARLIEMRKEIASKCKGLPLALRVLGGLMSVHPIQGTWRRVLESHEWKWAESGLFSALQLSYSLMPSYLRACFLFCSVFPKGYKLDKYELVRLWMAQEYIIARDGRREEDVGIDYFDQMQRMSIFERSWDGTFTMHDHIYNFSKSKTDGECCSIKNGDACGISGEVRHLHVIGDDKLTHNLISELMPIQLYSFFYKSADGTVPKYLSPFTAVNLRALELKLHDDFAAAPEITQGPLLNKFNVSSINFADFIELRYLRICDKSMESLPVSVCQLYKLQTLHLDDCANLRELPNYIDNLLNLRYFGLSDTSIQMLPYSVCRLFNLQSLILDRCRNLSALPTDIGCLSELRCIGLSRTNIKMLPNSFCNLSKLPILKLDSCKMLMELPSCIAKLIDLQSLQVIETKINSLPASVCRLYNLLELDMAGSDLVELPHDIGNLFNLRRLVLSHTNISVLPKSLSQLWSLHTLKLDGCKNLACLPIGIGNLAKLCELLLSATNIADLPESICKLSKLQRLELDGCTRLLRLPHGIGNLAKLCELLLSATNIADLPESICKVSKLQRLELDGCTRLLRLPHGIGQLTSLCHINLSDTEIAELPASICQLTNLQTLELNGCHRLAEMPTDIGNLINLHDLHVTETQVSELPISLCQLSKLKTLYLNGNRKLRELPSSIEKLTNLCHLELSQVAIEVLPKQICQLDRLERLNFEYMQKLPSDSY